MNFKEKLAKRQMESLKRLLTDDQMKEMFFGIMDHKPEWLDEYIILRGKKVV